MADDVTPSTLTVSSNRGVSRLRHLSRAIRNSDQLNSLERIL